MTIFYPDLKIAAGHNNAAGLVTVETIIATGDTRPFVYPEAWYHFNPGQFKIRTDQSFYIRGKSLTAWEFTFLTKNQYVYWSDTFCAGGYDGNVTIRTRVRATTYVNLNAITRLPKPSEVENRLGKIGSPVRIMFVSLEVI